MSDQPSNEVLNTKLDMIRELLVEKLANAERRLDTHEEHTRTQFAQVRTELENKVSKVEFNPVQLIAFGMVAVVVLAVLTAIVGLVVKSDPKPPVAAVSTVSYDG
ncbi:MAG: hypothetical protein E6Q76_06060 [Rhizobium sp.]|nr:MAG: hypothetical protein E6Q76_06060 [Rhizobium sp.]